MSSIGIIVSFQSKLQEPIKPEETRGLGDVTLFSDTVGDIAYLQEKTITPVSNATVDPFIVLRLNSDDEKNIRTLITDLDKKITFNYSFPKKKWIVEEIGLKLFTL